MKQTRSMLSRLIALDHVKDNLAIRQILEWLFLGTLFLVSFVMIVELLVHLAGFTQPLLESVVINISIILICTLSFWILRQTGHPVWGMRLYTYGLTIVITTAIFIWGGISSPLVLAYCIPIVAAGFLARSSDSLYVGLLAASSYGLIAFLQGMLNIGPVHSELTTWFNLVSFFTISLVMTMVSWSVSREIHRRLGDTRVQATQLMERTQELTERSKQQIEISTDIGKAVGDLQETSQQQASGSVQQASSVAEVSATIEELGSTARQIAQTADHVAQASQQTLESLSDGQNAVDQSIQAMERIRTRMQEVSARVLSLGERSQQIGEIINLIDDISDETHLLALNAAIEAAGAGEYGKRFAVVAAEVKNLANRTIAAAKEVKNVIAEIRQATNSAVLAAEEGGKEVERGVDLAHRAGQVMDAIVMMAERAAQSATEIGLATAQQQSASDQVVETMREIAAVARQSAASARQVAEAASKLGTAAERLHGTGNEHMSM